MDLKSAQKGVIHTVLIVMVMALVLAVGVYLYINNPIPTSKNSSKATENKQLAQAAPFDLKLESPTDGTVVTNGLLTVKGLTSPKTTVALYTENDESMVESDQNGNFSAQVPLVSGINTLTVTAFSEDGEEKSQTVDIVYNE